MFYQENDIKSKISQLNKKHTQGVRSITIRIIVRRAGGGGGLLSMLCFGRCHFSGIFLKIRYFLELSTNFQVFYGGSAIVFLFLFLHSLGLNLYLPQRS